MKNYELNFESSVENITEEGNQSEVEYDGSWKKNSAIHNKHVTVRKELPSLQQWQVTLTLTWLLTHTNLNKLAVIIFFVGFCFCFLFWRGTVTSSWRCSENQKKMTVMVNIIQTVKLLSSIN